MTIKKILICAGFLILIGILSLRIVARRRQKLIEREDSI